MHFLQFCVSPAKHKCPSTMAIGKSGAHNAGITAAQIIGVADPVVAEKLAAFKKDMAAKVAKKAESFA